MLITRDRVVAEGRQTHIRTVKEGKERDPEVDLAPVDPLRNSTHFICGVFGAPTSPCLEGKDLRRTAYVRHQLQLVNQVVYNFK